MFKTPEERDRFLLDMYCDTYKAAVGSVRVSDLEFNTKINDRLVHKYASGVADRVLDNLKTEFGLRFGDRSDKNE